MRAASSSVDAFIKLAQFVRNHTLAVILVMLVALFAASGVIGYRYAEVKIAEIEKRIETKDQHTTEQLKALARNDRLTHAVLDQVLEETTADRSHVFQLHNGRSSLKGVPFLYYSNTHERLAAGASSEIATLQQLPASLLVHRMETYLDGDCWTVETATAQPALQKLLERQGVATAISCPVFSIGDGQLMGFVGVDYNKVEATNAQTDAARRSLRAAATRVGTLLMNWSELKDAKAAR